MRLSKFFGCIFCLIASGFAKDLKIRVLDPQFNPVSQAQVQLLAGSAVKEVQTTSAEGSAVLHGAEAGDIVQVSAPGFALAAVNVSTKEAAVVHLSIAPGSETV